MDDTALARQLVDYVDATTERLAPPGFGEEREGSATEIPLLTGDETRRTDESSHRASVLLGAAAAAVALFAVGLFVAVDDDPERDRETADRRSADREAVETAPDATPAGRSGTPRSGVADLRAVGDRFTGALTAGEAATAVHLMSEDVAVEGFFGAADRRDVEGLFRWFDAADFRFEAEGCRAFEPDQVRCATVQSNAWSEAVGASPVRGTLLLTVASGRITAMSYIHDEHAWRQLVEDPFVDYMWENHPAFADPLWDEAGSPRVTDRSLALFEKYTAEYVEAVGPSTG